MARGVESKFRRAVRAKLAAGMGFESVPAVAREATGGHLAFALGAGLKPVTLGLRRGGLRWFGSLRELLSLSEDGALARHGALRVDARGGIDHLVANGAAIAGDFRKNGRGLFRVHGRFSIASRRPTIDLGSTRDAMTFARALL